MSTPETPPDLLLDLASDAPSVADSARHALTTQGRGAIPMLLSGLEDPRLGLMGQGRILRVLGELGQADTLPAIVAALRRALDNDEMIVRNAAMEALAAFQSSEALAELLALFQHADPAVVAYAAVLAGHTRLMAALAPLQALLAHADAAVRYGAVQGLIRLDDPQARRLLGTHLGTESDAQVRALITAAGIVEAGRTW